MNLATHPSISLGRVSVAKVLVAGILSLGGSELALATNYSVSLPTSSFNCSAVLPGDTVTLASGFRGPLKITDCTGTATKPIVIRNDSTGTGPTVIRRTSGNAGGFVFICDSCVGVVIDGSGKWAGAPSQTTYGIKVTMTGGGSPSAFLKISGLSRFLTIRNVEIDGVWPAISDDGIGISVNDHGVQASDHPGLWREGILVEENYVHNVQGEAMYIGSNWYTLQDIPLRDIEIRNNLIEDAGWEGIQLKSAIAGTNLIHGNIVRRVGSLPGNEGQLGGISLNEGNGQIYGNWVEDIGGSGIKQYLDFLPQSYGDQLCLIFNNVVVNVGLQALNSSYGISSNNNAGSALPVPRIYNNTVVRAKDAGIRVGPNVKAGFVRDNIVADVGSTPIKAPTGFSQINNRAGSNSQMGFISATGLNFRLNSTSPARDAGSTTFPPTDFDGIPRPQGGDADQGAFEYHGEELSVPMAPVIQVQ